MIDVAALSLAHFAPYIGEVFRICDPHYQEDLILAEATAKTDWSGKGRAAGSFELVLLGTSTSHVMEQGLRHFWHPELGDFAIFIAPRAKLPEGTIRYTAIFN